LHKKAPLIKFSGGFFVVSPLSGAYFTAQNSIFAAFLADNIKKLRKKLRQSSNFYVKITLFLILAFFKSF